MVRGPAPVLGASPAAALAAYAVALAYFALAGYACVLMNFMVVNVFFVGRHSYGGL